MHRTAPPTTTTTKNYLVQRLKNATENLVSWVTLEDVFVLLEY